MQNGLVTKVVEISNTELAVVTEDQHYVYLLRYQIKSRINTSPDKYPATRYRPSQHASRVFAHLSTSWKTFVPVTASSILNGPVPCPSGRKIKLRWGLFWNVPDNGVGDKPKIPKSHPLIDKS